MVRLIRMFLGMPTPQKQREEAKRIYNKGVFVDKEVAREQIGKYFNRIKKSQLHLATEYFTLGILLFVVCYASGNLSFLNMATIFLGVSGGEVMIVLMLFSSGEMRRNVLDGLDLNKILGEN